MKKIYLARHGESLWNTLKMIQGQKDVPLTEKGIKQAKLLGKRLKDEKIDKIYSSDLLRAYETARIVGEIINVEVIPCKEFREINFGIWEGMSNEELNKLYKKEYELWLREPEKLILEGAETLYDLQNRAISGINKIINAENNNLNNILIVSHSATIKAIILGLLDMNISYFKNLALGNVSLSVIEFRKYNMVLELFNDMNHIKER